MSSLTLNPFDLLGDEPRRKQPKPQAAAPKPATPKPAATQASKPAAATAKPAQQQAGQQKASTAKVAPLPGATPAKREDGAPRSRPQGDAQRGPRPEGQRRPPRQQGDRPPAPKGGEEGALPAGDKPFRPPRDRGDRRERAPQRGRQYDRRSGTGRPANENKRSGAGKGNWGKEGEEATPEAAAATKEAVEGEKEEGEKVVAEGEAAATTGEAEPPKEPEKELKGLDEYYESLKTKKVNIAAPKQREAGEGVDQSAWAGFVPLAKEAVTEEPLKNKKKDAKKEEAEATTGSVETGFYLPSPHTDDRRDSRRGGRGGRGGKGAPRPDRRQQPFSDRKYNNNRGPAPAANQGPAFSAEADFPALGGSAKPAAQPAQVKA